MVGASVKPTYFFIKIFNVSLYIFAHTHSDCNDAKPKIIWKRWKKYFWYCWLTFWCAVHFDYIACKLGTVPITKMHLTWAHKVLASELSVVWVSFSLMLNAFDTPDLTSNVLNKKRMLNLDFKSNVLYLSCHL